MTSFLSPTLGSGFGGSSAPSTDTTALKDINSQQQTFVNKDFVKNIAWLNNSVDTLSNWSQKLQSGVDQANQDVFQQIEGIWADLFALFLGFTPNGINIGDVKYVLQGIGALFGINPGTPFPINLFDAAMHMFQTYIVPTAQFTDVIFDAIEAWAEEFGLSPESLQSLEDLRTALDGIVSPFSELLDAIQQLVDAFGPDLSPFLSFFDSLFNLFDLIDLSALRPIIELLVDLGIPWIQALTAIINESNTFLRSFNVISGAQVKVLGDNFLPPISATTTVWTVGSNDTAAFVYDGINNAFETQGTGVAKSVVTQTIYPANPGAVFVFNGQAKWFSIPAGGQPVGIIIQWMSSGTVSSSVKIGIPLGFSTSQDTFISLPTATLTAPANIDGVRVGAYVDASVTTGQVWVAGITAQLQGTVHQSALPDSVLGILSLFGLNQIPGLFDVATAVDSFINDFINPVSLTDGGVISELLGAFDPVSLTDSGVIGELVGGLTGNQWFIDLVNTLGAVGLGTGAVTFLSNIPILSPIINTLITAWGGIGSGGFSLDQLELYATNIGNQFVQGLLGGATVGDTIQNQADAIVQGVYQDLTSFGNNFATVTGALQSFSSYLGFNLFGTPPDNSVAGQGIINNLYISKQAIYKPISIAIDQSTDAPFNITDIVTVANANGGTLPTPIVMHAGDQPVGCFIPTIHAGNKRSIKLMGYASGPIDVFYANVYKFDRTTGTSQLVYASPNFGPYLSASIVPIWYAFNISDDALVNTSQEDIYYITLNQWNGQATPSTFTLVGLDHYIDNQPSSVPATFGATGGYLYPTLNAAKSADPPALSYNVNKAISLGANDNAVVAMAVVYSTTTSMTGITATLATSGGTVPMTLAYLSPNISSNGDRLYIAMFTHKGTAGVAPYTGVNRQINVVATGCTGGAIAISAASYSGVSAFGAPQTNSGISAAAAITVAGVTSGINVVGFASDNGNFSAIGEQPLVSFNGQTRMYPNALADGWGFNGNQVFSTTLDASSHWYAVAIPVLSSLGLQDISLDADPWYADSTPWIGFGCELGASGDPVAPEPVYAPVVIPVYSSQVWTNPSLIWPYFNNFDFIVAGAGAGGDAGGFFQGSWGGNTGSWAGVTIPASEMGTDNITWNIGAPGPGGSSVGAGGGSGGPSSVIIPSVGTLSAPGGVGRGSALLTSGNLAGRGADNPGYSFDGDDFPGAAGGNAGQGAGNQPGSGGGGGNAFNTYGQNVLGGAGGPGIGWIVGYQ